MPREAAKSTTASDGKPREAHEREEDRLMSEQAHGQYYTQELVLDATRSAREQIQEALDNGAPQNWTLIGASDVPASGGTGASGVGGTTVGDAEASAERGTSGRAVILYWDTQRPSFARSTG